MIYFSIPEGLKYLTDLYVVRMHTEWKIPENLQWLEKNVKVLINKEKSIESYVNGNRKKYTMRILYLYLEHLLQIN